MIVRTLLSTSIAELSAMSFVMSTCSTPPSSAARRSFSELTRLILTARAAACSVTVSSTMCRSNAGRRMASAGHTEHQTTVIQVGPGSNGLPRDVRHPIMDLSVSYITSKNALLHDVYCARAMWHVHAAFCQCTTSGASRVLEQRLLNEPVITI